MKAPFWVRGLFTILFIGFLTAPVLAGTFYLHDHEAYWWYVVEDDGFSVVVPNNAERYVEKRIFGQKLLEMTWNDARVIMQVSFISGQDVETLREALSSQWEPLVSDVTMISDREITTSNDVPAYFYAFEGTGMDGQRGMLRSVFFSRDDAVVQLLMLLPSADYQGDLREYWLRAVNEFEWN